MNEQKEPELKFIPFQPCAGGHVFQYSGYTTEGRCPNDTPCQCGLMKAKWETCQCCGQYVLKAVPRQYEFPDEP